MNNELWQLFLETGAPEAYLMFKANQREDVNVSDNSGHRPEGHRL